MQAKKKIKQTDAIFTRLHDLHAESKEADNVLRLSLDTKATVKIGAAMITSIRVSLSRLVQCTPRAPALRSRRSYCPRHPNAVEATCCIQLNKSRSNWQAHDCVLCYCSERTDHEAVGRTLRADARFNNPDREPSNRTALA